MLVRQLLVSHRADTILSRPIGLIVPRSPHMEALTDASYEGLGGWSSIFSSQWRLSSKDLASHSWPVLLSEPERYKPPPKDVLYINVLEFLALFINTWLVVCILLTNDTPPGGWVLKFLADNTSALGWISHASRSHQSTIQNIACAYADILTFLTLSKFVVTTAHIPGVENIAADVLYRPYKFPTWTSTAAISPELCPLMAYWIPVELLLHLLSLVSSP